MYKEVDFKRYLYGVSDAGTTLLFKFRPGTQGLNEKLRNGVTGRILCGDECESVIHVLWCVLLTSIVGKSIIS